MRLEDRLRVYIDADVLLAGLATENSQAASRGILEASELTLLDLVAGQRVLDECERNLSDLASEGAALEELRRSLQAAVSRTVEVAGRTDSSTPSRLATTRTSSVPTTGTSSPFPQRRAAPSSTTAVNRERRTPTDNTRLSPCPRS